MGEFNLKQELLEKNLGTEDKKKLKIFNGLVFVFVIFNLYINLFAQTNYYVFAISRTLKYFFYFYLPLLFANKFYASLKSSLVFCLIIFFTSFFLKTTSNIYFGFFYTLAFFYLFLYQQDVKNIILSFKNKIFKNIFWGIILALTMSIHIFFSLALTHNLFWQNYIFSKYHYYIFQNLFINSFAEEYFYRYFLLNFFLKQKWSVINSVIYSSFLFAIIYVFSPALFTSPEIFLGVIYYIFIFGVFSGLVYLRTNSLLPSFIGNLILSIVGDYFV